MRQLFIQKPFKYSYFRATPALILANAIIFLMTVVFPSAGSYIYNFGALNVVRVHMQHMYWQFLTYMFVHQNLSHLFFNMFGLFIFGVQLERAIGSKEFLLFYFICGIIGGLFSYGVYFLTGQYRVFLMGASGAIYAVLFAYAVVYPRSKIYIWGILPVPAPLLVIIYTIIELGSEFTGRGGNVAHLTHLFGFASAWLYFMIRMKINPVKIWKNAYR